MPPASSTVAVSEEASFSLAEKDTNSFPVVRAVCFNALKNFRTRGREKMREANGFLLTHEKRDETERDLREGKKKKLDFSFPLLFLRKALNGHFTC